MFSAAWIGVLACMGSMDRRTFLTVLFGTIVVDVSMLYL